MARFDFDPDLGRDVDAVQAIPALATILDVVCRTTGMGFAAIARVTQDHWVACAVDDRIAFGLKPGGELQVDTTICAEIRDSRRPVVIDHVSESDDFRGHPTPAQYGFESYASFPITLPDGRFFGTLCAIDPAPHRLDTPQVRGMFSLFAELTAFHLDAQERLSTGASDLQTTRADLAASRASLAASAANLLDAERTAELREQFIAVLGHDLRNPLAAIDAGAALLAKQPLDARGGAILVSMRRSVGRMAGMIDNVMDFARGRLGGGVTLERAPTDLGPLLRHLVDEIAARDATRTLLADIDLPRPVDCDGGRLSQLVSNLLGNAYTHGAADQPVRLSARLEGEDLVIAVANGGAPIPAAAMPRLFQPFERGSLRSSLQGLGLGLYISAEIARAHGGALSVDSTPAQTVFTFRMPAKAEG